MGFAAASFGFSFPSGFVPGEEEDGWCTSPCDAGGEEGPDCNLLLVFKVLCAKFVDCAVISVFLRVPSVSCNSTTDD